MILPPVLKRSIFLLLLLVCTSITRAQSASETITVPDPNFEQALINLGIDSDQTINSTVLSSDVEFVETLDVSGLGITSLIGIEAFFNLKFLYAYNNEITGIDVSNNPLLVHLSLNNNSLAELSVTGNSLLEEIHINNNQLIDLNLGNNHNLMTLHAGGNQINTIDLSGSPKLTSLILWGSNLTAIDLSFNPELAELVLDDNNLSSLDVSLNSKLRFLYASNNQLTDLNIANGNNFNFSPPEWNDYSLMVMGNPDLNCIQVDEEIMGVIPSDWAKDFYTVYSGDCLNKPEYVMIPDPNFEQALIDLEIDSDGVLNALLLLNDAESVTGRLEISGKNISDLSGIEAFINITELQAGDNNLTAVDISQNTELVNIWFYYNDLQSLNISNNLKLERLSLGGNHLTSLDVSMLSNLHTIYIWGNNLSEFDVTDLGLLERLDVSDSPINTLDVSANLNLIWLGLANTRLSTINVSQNRNLDFLNVSNTQIDELDIKDNKVLSDLRINTTKIENLDLTQNSSLTTLIATGTALKTLDLSNNPEFYQLNVNDALELEHLDIRNGNNINMNVFGMANTPGLTCINADPEISQVMIDSGKNFSEDCSDFIHISDPNFEQALIDIGIDSDGVINQSILRSDAEAVEVLNVTNPKFVSDQRYANSSIVNVDEKIQDLTGIEAFVNLTVLSAWGNALTGVDVSNNVLLERIELVDNQITSIDVSENTNLEILWLETNRLHQIDVSSNTELVNLALGYNEISEIDVSNNTKLWALTIEGNDLTTVDVSQNSVLGQIWVAENPNLTHMDFSNNPELYGIGIYNTSISSLDLSNNPISRLYIANNPLLEHLDIRNGLNKDLNQFWIDNTPNLICINADAEISQTMINSGKNFSEDCGDFIYVPDPNFEQTLIDMGIDSDGVVNTSLLRKDAEATLELDVSGRSITELVGIESFVNLQKLKCVDNFITQLDLINLKDLKELDVRRNPLSQIDVTGNEALTLLYLSNTNIEEVDVSNNIDLLYLAGSTTPITSVDVSNNINLEYFSFFNTPLTSVDFSNNPKLNTTYLIGNNLKTIDFSNNPELYAADISNNSSLKNVDMRNGNNLNMIYFNASNTPNLTCINTDPAISQAMTDSGKNFSEDCGDFIYVPDPNFELSLVILGIDSDGVVNTSILREDAEAVTELNLNNPNFDKSTFANPLLEDVPGKISDLKGIEAFVSLVSLEAAYGALTEVDLSSNIQLEGLFLNDNQLAGVDVSVLPNLKRFGIMRNPIVGEIDLSGNPALEELFVHFTGIASIDLSANPNLWNLYIQNNQLTALDLSANTALRSLRAQNNNLSALDISMLSVIDRVDAQYNPNMTLVTGANGNPALTSLNLSGTGLANFNGAAYPNLEWLLLNDNNLGNFNGNNNLNLQNLFLNNNSITKLGLIGNTQLAQLQVMNNGMEELDLRNANNSILTTMKATGNLLTCISVDDPLASTMPYDNWELDPGVQLSLNCKQAEEVVIIPDPDFEQALIDLGYDTNGPTGNILLSEAEAVTILNISGKSIVDATGIEAFVNLTQLDLSNNLLTGINLQENNALINLNLSGNELAELFISSGRVITTLNAADNELSQLNFSDLTNLENLNLSGNNFQSLNFSEFADLVMLDVSNNQLTDLDLRNGNNMTMTSMDATGNFMKCIGVDDSGNIPGGWSIDDTTAYSDTGDCELPVVHTKNITVSLDRYGLAEIAPADIDNGSFDNVTDQKNLIFELDIMQFSCENIGENEVNLFVTDESGNKASLSALVTVLDEIAPNASAVRSISLDLNGATSVALDPAALNDGSTDNCGNLQFTTDRTSFSFPGNYTVEFSVSDGENSSSTSVDVEVIDSSKDITSLKFKKNLVATVYPNPFVDYFRIGFSKDIDLNSVDAKVFDMGTNLTAMEFVIDGNELNGEGILPGGEYILRLTINGETQTALISRVP